jgi:hypothetical protein
MTKEKARARREHLSAMRAEQKRKERRTAILMWGAGGLVIVLLVGLVGFYLVNERSRSSLDAVQTYKYEGSQHTSIKVNYAETPPVGGEHNPVWQNCGIYDEPINSENAVHSMEHGAVWITYRPDLPKEQVDRLKELASTDYMLLSPYPGLPSPIVVSSWNNQLALNDADDPRLPRYIARYKQNATFTPELGAACDRGLAVPAAQAPIPTESPTPAPGESPEADATPTVMPSAEPTPSS